MLGSDDYRCRRRLVIMLVTEHILCSYRGGSGSTSPFRSILTGVSVILTGCLSKHGAVSLTGFRGVLAEVSCH